MATASDLLQTHWIEGGRLIVVGALGAVTRLIAPFLKDKESDPAVLVLDAQGLQVVPLLGGHRAGGEQLARELAAALGGTAVITGDAATQGRLPLDSFGEIWGFRRSGDADAWRRLMIHQAQGRPIAVRQHSGSGHWRACASASTLAFTSGPDGTSELAIGPGIEAAPCRWHPATLWLGLGCERNTSHRLIERAVHQALENAGLAAEAVAGFGSIDAKGDEPALLALAKERDWRFRLFSASALAAMPVPTPSAVVEAEMGTASVAEAAALLAAGEDARLLQTKRILHAGPEEQGAVTVAIAEAALPFAPQRGELHLIGSGPGDLSLLTPDARRALSRCGVWVGYGLYLDLLEPLRRQDQVRLDGQLTRERDRCQQALSLAQQGAKVALVSSGDSGIYGMAGLALELWMELVDGSRPLFEVHPGLSALQLAAARAGAPLMHDFCTISLSDRLTPWPVIEQRLHSAAAGDFVVALYNPRSKGRDWQLQRAQEILLGHRPDHTPVVMARQLGRAEEQVTLHCLNALPINSVDMLTVLVIGNSSSTIEGGRMVTPRGYPGAELS
ncbi:bifunctional cobalt-precorrin-5A hydrolase / precorrin-3B C17-methyltransferase [Synechococcus sp. MEDNS5]|uniref:precorrin-3B C(17)-methyltransferase n=1 Tax=Synechococcus sp. MEDNS5 TaxID=1442554 RepID=UPI0016494AF4|nr:precorrin-3B C(17)-methyltransferase [Synechococcus sp. MEDNS5]QNJ05148.1 bifunctional cobalt-precorrin-5A hydrolase / precorrin-3B C17-methyltransferase [Synechococcus sp. MEDNS5]